MLRRASPGETYKYIDGVVTKFKKYVEDEILPKLSQQDLNHDQILTGLQYIFVHELRGHEDQILEVLSTHWVGKKASQIYDAALRAAKQGEIQTAALTRILAGTMLAQAHRSRDKLFQQTLEGLGKPAGLVLLDMIKPQRPAPQRRRLAMLVSAVAQVKSPYRTNQWAKAPAERIEEMKTEWEALIDPDGRIRKGLPKTRPSHKSDDGNTQDDNGSG